MFPDLTRVPRWPRNSLPGLSASHQCRAFPCTALVTEAACLPLFRGSCAPRTEPSHACRSTGAVCVAGVVESPCYVFKSRGLLAKLRYHSVCANLTEHQPHRVGKPEGEVVLVLTGTSHSARPTPTAPVRPCSCTMPVFAQQGGAPQSARYGVPYPETSTLPSLLRMLNSHVVLPDNPNIYTCIRVKLDGIFSALPNPSYY